MLRFFAKLGSALLYLPAMAFWWLLEKSGDFSKLDNESDEILNGSTDARSDSSKVT